jgi:hypothetical protein
LKRILKISGIILLIALSVFLAYGYYAYSAYKEAFDTENKPYKRIIGYIDQDKALLNTEYKLCDKGFIQRTYNGAGLDAYAINKKEFRDQLNTTFKTTDYNDSGYLNYRFLVNCEGNAGWFEIIEMNLDLEEQKLNPKLVNQLLEFTSNSKHWNILTYTQDNTPYNYYMYVSYRIENGKITEIIP